MYLSLSFKGRRQGGVICELGYMILRKSHRIVLGTSSWAMLSTVRGTW